MPAALWPELLNFESQQQSICLSLHIQPELPWFEGHFPNQPVLPGVVHTHWAGLFSQILFDVPNEFESLNRLKFQNPILPSQKVMLKLQHVAERAQVKFSYSQNDGTTNSSGSINFAQSEEHSVSKNKMNPA